MNWQHWRDKAREGAREGLKKAGAAYEKSPRVFWGILALVVAVGVFAYLAPAPREEKPAPTQPAKKEPAPGEPKKTYLLCVAEYTITTGYTEADWAPPSSSTSPYFPGVVAVHPRVPSNAGGDPRVPRVPFGTVYHLLDPKSIKVGGQWHDSFVVLDTGDINYGRFGEAPYWFDIYFGPTSYWTDWAARRYGVKRVKYYWYEEWKG